MKNIFIVMAVTLLSLTSSIVCGEDSLQVKVQAAMKMEHRTDADRNRDRNRRPLQALEFFGLKPDMKVIEFAPGAGWYTKILAPVLKGKGELYLVNSKQWLDELDELLSIEALSAAKKVPVEMSWNNKENQYEVGKLDFKMSNADMVLNIREYHNFKPEDKVTLNNAAFKALKKGGRYVIVDHSRRPMAPETFELRRREDPVKVILEVQAAGFVLEKSSDMFYRPDDELQYEVGRKTVTGNTDRFTLVFRKP